HHRTGRILRVPPEQLRDHLRVRARLIPGGRASFKRRRVSWHRIPNRSGANGPSSPAIRHQAATAAEGDAMFASRALRVVIRGILLPTLMGHAGGWAVITVDDLPESAEVGKPLTLSFVVRQHGVTLLDDLRPSVEAKSGETPVTTPVTPLGKG